MPSADEHRERAQATLRDFIRIHGRVPAAKEWDTLRYRPSRPTIRGLFGDWAAFVRSVGHEPLGERKPTADLDLDAVVAQLRAGKTLRSVAKGVDRTPQSLRIRVNRYLRLTGQPPLYVPRGKHPRRQRASDL